MNVIHPHVSLDLIVRTSSTITVVPVFQDILAETVLQVGYCIFRSCTMSGNYAC